MITRYVKKSLVENPYITLTAGLCIVGMAMPTWVYYNGGREKEAAMRFDLVRSVKQEGGERTRREGWRVVEANGWMDGRVGKGCGVASYVTTADRADGACLSPSPSPRHAIAAPCIRASMHRLQRDMKACLRDAH